MVGYGVDPDAPRIPYVTATVLVVRPLRFIWQPVWTVSSVIFTWFFSYVGEAWEDDVRQAGSASPQTWHGWGNAWEGDMVGRIASSQTVQRVLRTTTKRILRPTMDPDGDWSMSNDEVVF